MELFQLEDQFYPMLMKVYQAKYLMDDIMDYGVICPSPESGVQRFYAYTSLLLDVLNGILEEAERFENVLGGTQTEEGE